MTRILRGNVAKGLFVLFLLSGALWAYMSFLNGPQWAQQAWQGQLPQTY